MSEFEETIVDFGSGKVPKVAEELARINPTSRVIALEKQGFLEKSKKKNLLKIIFSGEKNAVLPFAENSIDKIFATFIFGPMSSEEYKKWLLEFARVAKKNSEGNIFLCETLLSKDNILRITSKIGLEKTYEYQGYPKGSEWAKRSEDFANSANKINLIPNIMVFSKG